MNVLPRIFSPWEVTALEITPVLLLTAALVGAMVLIALHLVKVTA